MTDAHHDPQAELDELASAHLDGQTSPEESRRVEGDPALLARVAHLRRVREALRVPGPAADPVRREAAISAALAAAGHGTPVDELATARSRRSGRRWLPLVGIAAAVVAAALLVPQLDDGGDGADETLASKTPTAQEQERERAGADVGGSVASGGAADSSEQDRPTALDAAGDPADGDDDAVHTPLAGSVPATGDTTGTTGGTTAGDAGAPAPATAATTTTTLATFEGGATTLAGAPPLLELGSFDDKASFTKAAQAAAAAPGSGAPAHVAAPDRADVDACVASLRADAEADGGTVLYAAVALVDEQAAVAIAVDLADGGPRLVRARHLEGCSIWFSRVLETS